MIKKIGLLFIALIGWINTTNANSHCLYYEPSRYAALMYYGRMTHDTLGQVIGFNYTLDQEKLYSVEASRYFSSESGIRRYFGQLVSKIALTANFTYHADPCMGAIYEVDPYLYAAWRLFTIPRAFTTYIALGEGLSWVSKVPTREHRNSDDPTNLLNYLMFELVITPCAYPNVELVGRIHHRSGVFGLYNANNSGSTAVGVALRFYFL